MFSGILGAETNNWHRANRMVVCMNDEKQLEENTLLILLILWNLLNLAQNSITVFHWNRKV